MPVLRAVGFSDATAAEVCKIEKAGVGRPSSEADAARDYIMEFLDDSEAKPWSRLERSAVARSIASAATLALVRAEMAKAGQIVQLGKGPSAKWLRTVIAEDDHE